MQRPCEDTSNQRWIYNKYNEYTGVLGEGSYTNLATNLDLNIAGGSGEMGAKLALYRHVPYAANAIFRITNQHKVTD